VATGGIVKGDGVTFTGPVTFDAGAIHAPGNSPGLQSFTGGLSYAAGSHLQWELVANAAELADRGTLYDAVDVIFGPLSIVLWAVLAVLTAAFAHFQGRAFLRGISG
jgi:hypothetical protein